MEWAPVTGSWPAREKGSWGRGRALDAAGSGPPIKILFFFSSVLFFRIFSSILSASAMRVATGNIPVLYRPAARTRMGKGHEKVCGLCIYVVHGKWGLLRPPAARPSRDFCPICLDSWTPPHLYPASFSFAGPGGKVHAVQVIHLDLIPVCHMIFFSPCVPTLDRVGFCCPSCERAAASSVGRAVGGGCEVARPGRPASHPVPHPSGIR